MAKRNAFVKRHVLTSVKFLLAASVIQCLVLLLFTSQGLALVYSCVSRMSSHRIIVGDDSYVDYYVFRDELESAELISLSIDKTVSSSYALAADFIASIKYSAALSAVALDEPYALTSVVAKCAAAESYSELSEHIDELARLNASDGLISLAEAIYNVNEALPPQSRITVECIDPNYYVDHAISQLSLAIDSEDVDLPDELIEYVENGDYCSVCELFDSYDMYRGAYGEDLDRVIEELDPYFNDMKLADISAADRLKAVESACSDAVLVIVGSDNSPNELFCEFENVQILYLDIVCADDNSSDARGEFSCRLVKLSDIDWFENYRSAVLGEDTRGEYLPMYRFYIDK